MDIILVIVLIVLACILYILVKIWNRLDKLERSVKNSIRDFMVTSRSLGNKEGVAEQVEKQEVIDANCENQVIEADVRDVITNEVTGHVKGIVKKPTE